MICNSDYGVFRNLLFTEVWNSAQKFLTDYQNSKLQILTQEQAQIVYYLLYAKYGNNMLRGNDVNQFKYKVYSIMWTQGPTWAKRVDIQKKLRELTEDQILKSSKQVVNHALNPSTAPSTSSLDELTYINEQNTRSLKRSKVEGYALLLSLLDTDVTEAFIRKFEPLFANIVQPEGPAIFEFNMEDYQL